MTAEQATTAAYLAVSLISLAIQGSVLRDLRRTSSGTLRRPLVRTSASRVFCAVLYVAVGFNGLFTRWHIIAFTFAVFCAVQAIWLVNARLDRKAAQIRRPAPGPYRARHLA